MMSICCANDLEGLRAGHAPGGRTGGAGVLPPVAPSQPRVVEGQPPLRRRPVDLAAGLLAGGLDQRRPETWRPANAWGEIGGRGPRPLLRLLFRLGPMAASTGNILIRSLMCTAGACGPTPARHVADSDPRPGRRNWAG